MGHSRPIFRKVSVTFNETLQFLQEYKVKKCSSSIWCWESNPQPLEHESHHITTRPVWAPALQCAMFILYNIF